MESFSTALHEVGKICKILLCAIETNIIIKVRDERSEFLLHQNHQSLIVDRRWAGKRFPNCL